MLFLVVVAMPVLAIPTLVGGVSTGEVVRGVGAALVVAVVYTAIGVGVSALARSATAALMLSMAVVLSALLMTTTVWFGAQAVLYDEDDTRRTASVALLPNPVVAVADFVSTDPPREVNSRTPVDLIARGVAYGIDNERNDNRAGDLARQIERNFGFLPFEVEDLEESGLFGEESLPLIGNRTRGDSDWNGLPFWAWSGVFHLGVIVVLWSLAARRLRLPMRDDR